jgi:sugar fermentation stimulation protein A
MRVPDAIEGTFYKRLNRFSCLVQVRGELVECFLPNPGRLQELLIRGRKVLLLPKNRIGRKTAYDLFAVHHNNAWVVVDSRVPNLLVYEVLRKGILPELAGYEEIRKEPFYGASRLDFLLQSKNKQCLLEVKSCTLVKDGVALFPDAPTERGRRHVEELMRARSNGLRACVLFLIQRDDARVFSSNDETDKRFGEALRAAAKREVEVLAYSSTFDGRRISLSRRVPIAL